MKYAVLVVLSLAVGCASAPPKKGAVDPPKDPAIAIVKTDLPRETIHLPSATPEKHFATAQHAVAEGKYGEARASLDQAIGMKPDWAEAYLLRGNVAALQGEASVAFADYDRAVTYRPDLVDALVARAQASLALDQIDLAIADFDRAIMVAPRRAPIHYQKALAHFARNDDIKALSSVNQAIVIDPLHAESYRLRAQLDLFAKDYPKAIEDASRAIELTPGDQQAGFASARAWAVRGNARLLSGDKAGAKKDFENAVRLDPSLTDELRAKLLNLEHEGK